MIDSVNMYENDDSHLNRDDSILTKNSCEQGSKLNA